MNATARPGLGAGSQLPLLLAPPATWPSLQSPTLASGPVAWPLRKNSTVVGVLKLCCLGEGAGTEKRKDSVSNSLKTKNVFRDLLPVAVVKRLRPSSRRHYMSCIAGPPHPHDWT